MLNYKVLCYYRAFFGSYAFDNSSKIFVYLLKHANLRSLVLLLLFTSYLSFGQKFEVSETAGYSIMNANYLKSGFSNQFTLSYYIKKQISLSATYEYESWAADNSFGIASDYHLKLFYLGVEIKELNIAPDNSQWWNIVQYDRPSYCLGIHAGIKQKIVKQLFLNAQIGFVGSILKGINTVENAGPASTGGVITYQNFPITQGLIYFYMRVGVSYIF